MLDACMNSKATATVRNGPYLHGRCALQNAASVAGLMLTTEAIVAEKPKEKETPADGHGGHGHPSFDERVTVDGAREFRVVE
jgi:hypothetical protein